MKLYKKIVNGEYQCKPAIKIVVIKDGMQIFNPSEAILLEDGWIIHQPEIKEISEEEEYRNNAISEIEQLKEELASTDYKVVKCTEAFLCGEEMPYNIEELHIERNAIRYRINELEELL